MTISVYLDWNATTPPHADVMEAMSRVAVEAWGNPSSTHASGRRARAVVEDAREAVAALVRADPRDVLFTSGGTEANNLALFDVVGLALSAIEHPSVVRVAEAIAARGRPVQWLPVTSGGRVEVAAVSSALARLPAGSTVAVAAANHETGVLQPVGEIAEASHAVGCRLHVDAVQAAGKVAAIAWRGADSVSISAHKIRGPKGIGALAWWGPPPGRPLLFGGEQERGLRPGTLDPAAAAGFHKAAERAANDEGPRRYSAIARLRDELERRLVRDGGAEVNGAEPRLPHVTNVSFPGWRGDELVAALDLNGVQVSSGSACAAGTAEPSRVIAAMSGPDRAAGAVRASLGETTTEAEVERAISVWLRVLVPHASSA